MKSIKAINKDAAQCSGEYELIFTDPPFELSGAALNNILSNFKFKHLLLIASMHQVLEFAKHSDLQFSFDLVVSHVTPKKSRNYAQPNYIHSNIVYFKSADAKSAFDRRRVMRSDHYSDSTSHYYPSIFHAPKRDLTYKYQKNQAMLDDLLGAFDVASVCDPFAGSFSTGFAALKHAINCTLIEKNTEVFNQSVAALSLLTTLDTTQ